MKFHSARIRNTGLTELGTFDATIDTYANVSNLIRYRLKNWPFNVPAGEPNVWCIMECNNDKALAYFINGGNIEGAEERINKHKEIHKVTNVPIITHY